MAGAEETKVALPGANASFLADLLAFLRQEDAKRFADQFSPYVEAGGTHGTVAGLVGTPAALTAYPGGFLVTETGSITYPDDTSFIWVICHKDLTGNVGVFTRVAGTHYLTAVNATQPTIPADSLLLMQVTTAGGSVTAAVDKRTTSPGGAASAITFTPAGDLASTNVQDALEELDDEKLAHPVLTNQTGGALAAGDVVAIDSANNSAVALSDVQGSLRPFVVALETIADGASGRFQQTGRVATLAVQGAVTRGNWCRKASASKAAEDTGTAAAAAAVLPPGTLAIALSAAAGPGAGTVAALLLGFTAVGARLSIASPAQLTANQNDYDPSSLDFWRLTSDASRTITGIAGVVAGRLLVIANVGSNNIVLANQSASSAAANRIITGLGADLTLGADDVATLLYDDTTARWRVTNVH